MDDFISEQDLETFEGWLRYQAVSPVLGPKHGAVAVDLVEPEHESLDLALAFLTP